MNTDELKAYLRKYGAVNSVAQICEETGATRGEITLAYDQIVAENAGRGKPDDYGAKYTAWSEAESERLMEMLSAGTTYETAGRALGRTPGSVASHVGQLRKQGRLTEKYRRHWTEGEVKRLQKLRQQKKTIPEIAHRIGRTEEAVRQRLMIIKRLEDHK